MVATVAIATMVATVAVAIKNNFVLAGHSLVECLFFGYIYIKALKIPCQYRSIMVYSQKIKHLRSSTVRLLFAKSCTIRRLWGRKNKENFLWQLLQ